MSDEPITTPGPAYVPPVVLDYLGSKDAVSVNLELLKQFEIKDTDMSFIFELIWDVIERRKAPKAVQVELRSHFKRWDENKVKNLAIEILGRKLLPLSNFIPGIEQEMKDLGAVPEEYPSKKVVPPAVAVEDLVANMIQDLQIRLEDKFLKHRLENVITSKIKGVRDDFEIKNRLIRGSKIGGLDIAPSVADQIIQYVDSAKETVKIVDEKRHEPGVVPAPPKPEVRIAPVEEVPDSIIKKETGTSEAFTVRPEDIQEIRAEESRNISSEILNEYARVEKEIITASGYNFSDPDQQKRFEKAVQARVRDVRDELETTNLLTRGPIEGGLGLAPDKAKNLIDLINSKTAPLKERLTKIETAKKAELHEKAKREQEISKERENAELDSRFAKLTGRTPSALPEEQGKVETTIPLEEERVVPAFRREKKQPPALEKEKISSPDEPIYAETPAGRPVPRETELSQKKIQKAMSVNVNAPRLAPPLPATSVPSIKPSPKPVPRVSPSTPFSDHTKVQADNPAKPGMAPSPIPPKPKVRVSAPGIARTISGKPKMEEIKFSKKLFGPVEELKEMKLEDFRRLSKDPKERAIKIKDKIDLLEEESFEKRMQGATAWQQSPVNRVYLNLIQDAFQTGKNIQTIISEREAQGRQTLNWEEFQAILDVNQKIKI